MQTFLNRVGRSLMSKSLASVSLALLVILAFLCSPMPALADSYYWKCPEPQSITIGVDDFAEYLTKDFEGDGLAFIVTGSAHLTTFPIDGFEWQIPLTYRTDKLTKKPLCLQSGDSLAMQVRLVELYDQYYSKPLGEFEVSVINTGTEYYVEWCTQQAQTTLFTDEGQPVASCAQTNAINVFTVGDESFGMHISLWFSTPEAANSNTAFPVTQPFASLVVSRHLPTPPTATPWPTPTPTPQPARMIVPFQTLQPANGACLTQGTQFEWQDNIGLPAGHLYEIVVWRAGEDPMNAGRGVTQPDTRTSRWVDLAYLDDQRDWFAPGDYNWGILEITNDPYQRYKLLGSGGWFHYVLNAPCSQ